MSRVILVVDDSAVLRASVKFTLSRGGHEVVEACDGSDGLLKLAAIEASGKRLGLVITDVNMPVMDGITFIREVKKTPHRFAPILVLTTESQGDKKLEGKAAGATGWLVKPFQEQQLLDVVKKLVR
jgi:two-component system chemotaxis response regulator CheY